MRRLSLALVLLSLAGLPASGCGYYDAPPQPRVEGAEDGVLEDPKAPLVVRFAEAIDPATLKLSIVRFETDVEGNLFDEDADPDSTPNTLFSYDQTFGGIGGTAELIDGNTGLRIMPSASLPIGPKLALLVEPGLSDTNGNATTSRKRLLFGYAFKLDCTKPSANFPTGKYFLLADIKQPLKVQVQLWASFQVDPLTGLVRGQCTNADRDMTPGRCPMACSKDEACRLIPEPACVAPSERAGTPDEFSDYVPFPTPPLGYSFTIDGCAQDQEDGSVVFATAPVDVIVQQPPVTLRNVTLTAQFATDTDDVLRGLGSLAADSVIIGTTASGKGEGSLVGRLVADDKAPKDIPEPPPVEP